MNQPSDHQRFLNSLSSTATAWATYNDKGEILGVICRSEDVEPRSDEVKVVILTTDIIHGFFVILKEARELLEKHHERIGSEEFIHYPDSELFLNTKNFIKAFK